MTDAKPRWRSNSFLAAAILLLIGACHHVADSELALGLFDVSPPGGTSLGGTSVMLTGRGFLGRGAGPSSVTFDGVPATSVVVVSDTRITCDAPAGAPGLAVDVVVVTTVLAASLADGFAYHAEPTVTLVTAATGTSLGGVSVVVRGTGFQSHAPGPNTVAFGGVAATNVQVVNDTRLTCDTPPGTPGLRVDVDVINANGMGTRPEAYLYHPVPAVTGIQPAVGSSLGGTSVTMSGSGFLDYDPGPTVVVVGGVPATNVTVVDDVTITFDTPAGTPGALVEVDFANENGTESLADAWRYYATPVVTDVQPAAGTALGNEGVTITGTGFTANDAGPSAVTFGSVPAPLVIVVDDTTLTAITPPGTPGTSADVTVANANGAGTLPDGYAYLPAPEVTTVTPPSGSSLAPTAVTITGSGFQDNWPGAVTVTFGGVPAANIVVLDDARIACDAPPGAPGFVDVTVSNTNGTGTLADGFEYRPPPSLLAVLPSAGTPLGGTAVTLTGAGFRAGTPGAITVTFGGQPASDIVVVDDTTITARTPAGAPGAAVDVVLANELGTATLADGYAYHPAPTLALVDPASGPSIGGTLVTLTGAGFVANGAGANTVTFDGVLATGITVVSDTALTCNTPAGTAGAAVDVAIANANGAGVLANAYAYEGGGASASLSSVWAAPSSGVLADGVASSTITVVVRDSSGAPLAGQVVELFVSGSQNTVLPSAGITDAAGTATFALASLMAEVKTITATVDPLGANIVLADTPTVGFVWASGSAFYVRIGGSDQSAGTSPAQAWRTISRATGFVEAGDTVYVGAGTYVESASHGEQGAAGAPIRFVADRSGCHTGDAGEVVIDAAGGRYAFRVSSAAFIIFDGFTVTGATGGNAPAGIVVSGPNSDHVVIRNCRAYGNQDGIRVQTGDAIVVESNVVSNNFGLGIQVSAPGALVRNNLVYNNGSTGILSRSSANALIELNTVYRNTGANIAVTAGGSATVQSNIVTDALGDGIAQTGSSVVSSHNDSWGNTGADWSGVTPGTGDFSADPGFVDPAGADGLLGGAQGLDDRFQLDAAAPSPAFDAGVGDAAAVRLSDGTALADTTSRIDGHLDGEGPDGATINLGFHYPALVAPLPALDQDDGRLVYGRADAFGPLRQPAFRTWDDSGASWSTPGSGLPAGVARSRVLWTLQARSPLANGEELTALLTADPAVPGSVELAVHKWDGCAWSSEWSSRALDLEHRGERGFDLAYESGSGDAMVVYSTDAATPAYRTWSGGVWSPELALPLNDGGGPDPDVNDGVVQWVELERRPGTDELALAYVDANFDLVAIVWDGGAWLPATAKKLEADLARSQDGRNRNRVFDLAYETTSGDLLVAWRGASDGAAFRFEVLAGSGAGWTGSATVLVGAVEAHFLELAADPAANDRIALAAMDLEGVERLALATWNGTGWQVAGEVDAQVRNFDGLAHGDFPAALAWVGTSGVCVCVYADEDSGRIDWARFDGGAWSVQPDLVVGGLKARTESLVARTFRSQNALMIALSDELGALYAATCDGTSWSVAGGGAPLEPRLSSLDSVPFGLALEP